MGNHYWYLILSVICICIILQTVRADLLDIEDLSSNSRSTRKLCGKNLADTLRLACEGAYNQMYKKSENDQDYLYQSDQEDPSVLPFPQQPFPFRSRIAATQFVARPFRRFTRGIIQECCRKPCSLMELKTYCSNSPRK